MLWYFIPPSSHVSTVSTAVFYFFLTDSTGFSTLVPFVIFHFHRQACMAFSALKKALSLLK